MEDADSAWLQAAMDVPVTASLGPMGPLLQQLHSLGSPPKGVSEEEIQLFKEDLGGLCLSLKDVSEAEDASSTAKWWMKEVRELCYDTQDYLDEVTAHYGAGAGAGAGVRRKARLSTIFRVRKKLEWHPQIGKRAHGRFQKIPTFSFPKRKNLKRRPQTAISFSELMARVEALDDVSERFKLGPKAIKPDFAQGGDSHLTPKLSLQLPVPISVHADTGGRSIVGVEEPMNKLVDLLAFDDDNKKQLKVVPIFGSAGVGKTTLARTIYDRFGGKFQCRAFLRVSRIPDMRRLLNGILSQIKAPRSYAFSDAQDLIDNIREHLQGKRYAIIIDDLWTTSVWNIISRAFPDDDCCSRIITTTQIDDVALACCSYYSEHIYEMSPLNDDESRKLFFGRVFGSEDNCPTDIKEVSYEIIRKCGGLPLAITIIASLLASDPNIVTEKWKHIQDSLASTSEGMRDVLYLIYNSLPPHLKTFLLYLSMYPEGYLIGKHDLVEQWVAEGFLGAVEGQDTEEIAESCFDELVSRGMVQAVDTNYDGEVLSCTVHHMVLDLIRNKSIQENFVITVDNFQSTPALPDKVRRLSIQFGGAKGARIPESIIWSQVRSLKFGGFFECVPSIADYGFLRVLILHIWADENKIFDLSGIGELFRLRYLKIECNMTIKLPAKIGGLQCLETLEIDARLSAVPSDIVHLEKLLHLRLPSVSNLPHGVGHMTSLRTLGYFDLGSNSEDNVLDIGKLTNIHDLHLTCSTVQPAYNLQNNMKRLGSILGKLSNLKCLALVPAAGSSVNTLQGDAGASTMSISCDGLSSVSPAPVLLERLELTRMCIFPSLPKWFGELSKLCILKIAVRELSKEDIDILRELPALTSLSLYIQTAPADRIVIEDKEGFPVLTYFKFMCTAPCLSFMRQGAMPNVRKLKLGFNANRMKPHSLVDAGFKCLTGLREISLKLWGAGADESDRRAAESALQFAVTLHPNTLISRVQCVDVIFDGEDNKSNVTQGQEQLTPGMHREIEEIKMERPSEDVNEEIDSGISTKTESSSHLQNPDIRQILLEAQNRWLRPTEICQILSNYKLFSIAPEPPNRPQSGSLFLFDRRILRYFRKDGHIWRNKKDGKTVKEAHERLKVGSVDVLDCYYAHGEENENFQRRTYWLLQEGFMNIVLVHYLEIKGGKQSFSRAKEAEESARLSNADSPACSNSFASQSQVASQTMDAESPISGQISEYEDAETDNCRASSRYHPFVEMQQPVDGLMMDNLLGAPAPITSVNLGYQGEIQRTTANLDNHFVTHHDIASVFNEVGAGLRSGSKTLLDSAQFGEPFPGYPTGYMEPTLYSSVATMGHDNLDDNSRLETFTTEALYTNNFTQKETDALSAAGMTASQMPNDSYTDGSTRYPLLKQSSLDLFKIEPNGLKKFDSFSRWMSDELAEVADLDIKSSSDAFWSSTDTVNVADGSNIPINEHLDAYVVSPSLSQDQLFSIIDVSPSWAYSSSKIKVLITGTFLTNKEDVENCKWSCMFGDVEVPAEVLADGSLRCYTPVHQSGRVPFYVTCSNRVACSEVREFEFRDSETQYMETADLHTTGINEMHLHIRLEKLLSLGPDDYEKYVLADGHEKSELINTISSLMLDDKISNLALSSDEKEFSAAQDKNLEKLVKEKLYSWLLHKIHDDGKGPNVLGKEGQGVIHLVAALGYDWAIRPIITAGVHVNFRDARGWTALHWAASCGRERTVGALITNGAASGALTDPTPQFPSGRTPADLASENGYKGIAGFLAESALTSHLSALTLKESKGGNMEEIRALAEADDFAESSSAQLACQDFKEEPLKDSLSAVRKSTQAAARIFQAFRVESFHRKKVVEYGDDDCGLSDERTLSLVSLKNAKPGQNDMPHSAAVRIQNKFRGWKGKKEFMIIRQKIIKIQAHVRGHQVRRNYRKIVWSVGIVEKVILRWRRKGRGLRGFQPEKQLEGPSQIQPAKGEDEYDFLKDGRKQAEGRLQRALDRVKSMTQYPEAREQYSRLQTCVTELQESKAIQDKLLSDAAGADGGNFMVDWEDLCGDDDTPMSTIL